MKKCLLLLLALVVLGGKVAAQLPNGSIAPDFTTTDIDGGTHNLYSLLGQGKTVFMDIFATWCGPCWSYHNSHAMANLWDAYGPPGTDEAFVLAIEGDPSTNLNCIYGPSGCVGGTQGNWTNGTPYPICDDAGVANLYDISFYPTIYCICPLDQKVYVCGQLPMGALWNFRNTKCVPPPMSLSISEITNVGCFGTSTGAIDLQVSGGAPPYNYNWSNGQHNEDMSNLPAGTYSVTVQGLGGSQAILNNIVIAGPTQPMTLSVSQNSPLGCAVAAELAANANGGWLSYEYAWSNGATSETIGAVAPGNYIVTATDAGGCTKVSSLVVAPAIPPVASVAPAAAITCAAPSITLDASASTQGPDITYQWQAGQGGNIVSGATTMTPLVNAAGTYVFKVTNTENGCTAQKIINVSSNVSYPSADAGPSASVTCANPSTTLQGTASTGQNFTYLWTALNGGNIVSGAGSLQPNVNAPGMYVFKVTNSDNGCFRTDTTLVSGNNVPPTVAVAAGTLTCTAPNLNLSTTTNANNAQYAWTGPNGWTSTAANPNVNLPGTYNLAVTDQTTGCSSTATANVAENVAAPGVSTAGGTLTCSTTNLNLAANSTANNVSFVWSGPANFTSNLSNVSVNQPGTYNVVATWADNGCTSSAAATVVSNTALPTAAAATPSNLNCNTSQLQLNGTASSQGTNFTYHWAASNGGNIVSGENTSIPLVNAPGSYSILVTNLDNGCTSTAATSVLQSPAVAVSISNQNNVSCNGATDGTAQILAGGGNGTFTFAWSNGASTANIGNLAAGIYSVTATDGENCTASTSITVSQPEPLACNAAATPQTSNGVSDGTATANPSGGTANFTFNWSNGQNTQTISNLAPGSYSVTVADANGCTSAQTVTVNSFNCSLSPEIVGSNVTCNGAANGTANVEIAGATHPITYNWSNGATTANLSGLAPGIYTVQIMDAGGCPAELSVSIAEPIQLLANATSSNETAQNANDGTASAAPTGGVSPYEYAWSNGANTQTVNGLAPGGYIVSVTDANGCVVEQQVVVAGYVCSLSPDVAVSHVRCNGAGDGQATVVVTGGIAPFNYLWSDGQTSATATDLDAGDISVLVTDLAGCQISATVTLVQPEPISIELLVVTDVACPGDANGSASVTAAGGTGNAEFLWSNGENGPVASALTVGTHIVSATDANGCQQVMSVNVVAEDNVAPVVSLQNATLALPASGEVDVTLAALGAEISENCSIGSVQISPETFNCAQLGEHQVVVTVFDAAGNSSSATATVNVVDNFAPIVTCPNSITACHYDNPIAYPTPTAQDNCSGIGHWDLVSGLQSGSMFPVGVTSQVYNYTDAAGNSSSCAFDVIIVGPASISGLASAGCFESCEASLTVLGASGGQQPYTFQWSNGQTGATVTGLCDANLTLSILDDAGCRSQQDLPVNVPAPLALSVVSVKNDVDNQGVGAIDIQISGGALPYNFAWTDQNGATVATSEDAQNLPAGTYNVQVTDANGCVISNVEGIVVGNTVGSTEPIWAKGLQLVPNPTSGAVQVRFKDLPSGELALSVMDAAGRILLRTASTGEQTVNLDLSAFPAGVYSVRLQMEGAVLLRKLVVSK